MYESSSSAVLLEDERSASFSVKQGVAQGCSLSPILFSVFINDLLKEVDNAGLDVKLSSGERLGGLLFADDFVGISESKESLQSLIDVVHTYCNKWRLKATVTKSAVIVFSRESIEGSWRWGERELPKVEIVYILRSNLCLQWVMGTHIKKVLDSGKKKANQLHSVISNRSINLTARRLLLLSVAALS